MGGRAPARVNRFERHRGLVLAGLAMGLAFGTDLAGTWVMQSVGRNQHSLWTPTEKKYRRATPVYHHGLRPNASVDNATWGPIRYAVRTNSLGFKDASNRVVALQPKGRRVVFIGDSFTEGVGVPYEQTWVGLVDRQLAKRGIEVLNAGVCSYAPIIYYAKVKHLVEEVGLRFDELVVYIDISDAQDEMVTYRFDERGWVGYRPKNPVKMPQYTRRFYERTLPAERFIADTTSVSRFLMLSAGAGQVPPPRGQFDPVVDLFRSAWTYDREAFEWYGRPALVEMTRHMDQLAALAKEHGFRLTVGVYPWPGQVMYDIPESKPVRHWREWAARHDAGFVNHFPDFLDPTRRRETIEKYYMVGDFHWNEAGHRRIAERFLASWQGADRGKRR